jgi:hypothetical protein
MRFFYGIGFCDGIEWSDAKHLRSLVAALCRDDIN